LPSSVRKHVQVLRRMHGAQAKRDLQRVVEAAAKQPGLPASDDALARAERRVREVCDRLELETQRAVELEERAALADAHRARADEAERALADANELRASAESQMRHSEDLARRLQARLDVAAATHDAFERARVTAETGGGRLCALEREVVALRAKNAEWQAELAARACAPPEEMDEQRSERERERDEACALRLNAHALQARIDTLQARAAQLEHVLRAREERAAKDVDAASQAAAAAKAEASTLEDAFADYHKRVCRAAEALGRARQRRVAASAIAHWWRLQRVERSAFERSSEVTKAIKAKVKADVHALERRVEEGVTERARLRKEKSVLETRLAELEAHRAVDRSVDSLVAEVRDLVAKLEAANAELAELRAAGPMSTLAVHDGAGAPESTGRLVREYEARLARLEAELVAEHLRLTSEGARRMELEQEALALKLKAKELQAELTSLRLKGARAPLAAISLNAQDDGFGAHSIPESSSAAQCAAALPSAAVAGIPRRSFFRPSTAHKAAAATVNSPPVSIREEASESGECAQQ